MNSAEVLIKFKGDTSDADSKTKTMSATIKGLTTSFTLANVAAKGITKAISIFESGLDGAISRVDVLNNFPKVMDNLGISADDSSSVISDLSDKLKGLPTSLDAGAAAVQRFTSKNGDVKESEKIFLAVNNAILAGGANAQVQSSALEQISQAYAKGKPDMVEWRSLMSAMPAQLKQVSKAMGYVNADDLGEALRSGTVSMDDFMNTMVKLNESGVDGFATFEEQARNATGGISTSVKNMKTAFTRGIGNVVSSIDSSLSSFGGLSGVLNNIGKAGETFFTIVGQGLGQIIPLLTPLFTQILPVFNQMMEAIMPSLMNLIQAIVPVLVSLLTTLLPPLMQIVGAILPPILELLTPIIELLQPLIELFQPIIEAIMTLLEPLTELLDAILPPIIEIFRTLINSIMPPLKAAFQTAGGVIKNVFSSAFGALKPIIENVKGILKGLVDFISGVFSGNWEKAWQGVKDIFKNIIEGIGNIFKAPINFIIDGMNAFIRGLNNIKIPDWVPGVGGKGLNIKEIPKLNVGTNYVPQDMFAIVHKGEAVIPKEFNPYANGINASTLGAMQNNSPRPIINVYADFEMDPIGQVVSSIKTFSGGAKNDYNYGQGV